LVELRKALNRCAADAANRTEDALRRIYENVRAKVGDTSEAGQQLKLAEEKWQSYRDSYLIVMFPEKARNGHYGSMHSMQRSFARQRLAMRHTEDLKDLLDRYDH
jgi:hypothetical protein